MSGVKQILPAAAYTSQEWFDWEQDTIFSQCWQFACMASDLPNQGDYLCKDVGRYHLIIVRGDDNELRAFHNQCRHRGTKILEGSGQLERGVRCPYHNWFYTFKGDLRALPQPEQFPEIDKANLGLYGAGIAFWRGMVFVHPEPDQADTFEDYLDGIEQYMGPHQPEKLVEIDATEFTLHANWKVFVENYMDGYHLAYLHSDSIKEYNHQEQQAGFIGKHWTFYEPPSEQGLKEMGGRNDFPLIDHLNDQYGAFVHMMFPNFGITESETMWVTLEVIPVSPSETTIRTRTRAMKFSSSRYLWMSDKSKKKQAQHNDPAVERFKTGDVMEEDIIACEAIQASMGSPKFSVGALASRDEKHLMVFQQWVKYYVDGTEFTMD